MKIDLREAAEILAEIQAHDDPARAMLLYTRGVRDGALERAAKECDAEQAMCELHPTGNGASTAAACASRILALRTGP